MAARFVGLVGSLTPEEQQIWFPNQLVNDPQTWVAPYLLQLKSEYTVLLNKYDYKEQEMYIVQDQPLLPSELFYYHRLKTFTRFIREIRSSLSRGILDLILVRLATIATYTVQADDEEMGGLGGKHCQGYE